MLGSCLRNEHNKGINYCRHHQDWNDTALCTPFPWQPARGRWMFHSHSALQYTSINHTCIKSTRFLLWALLRAGLFSCYCIIKEKQHKTMRSFLVKNKTQKLRIYLRHGMPFIQRGMEQVGLPENQKSIFLQMTDTGFQIQAGVRTWSTLPGPLAPPPPPPAHCCACRSARTALDTVKVCNLIVQKWNSRLLPKFIEAEQADTCFYLHWK